MRTSQALRTPYEQRTPLPVTLIGQPDIPDHGQAMMTPALWTIAKEKPTTIRPTHQPGLSSCFNMTDNRPHAPEFYSVVGRDVNIKLLTNFLQEGHGIYRVNPEI